MPKFVIDEDMPRSTGAILKEHGYDVKDVRDYGLRGAEDEEIYEFAQREKAVILTGDRGFSNIFSLTHFSRSMPARFRIRDKRSTLISFRCGFGMVRTRSPLIM